MVMYKIWVVLRMWSLVTHLYSDCESYKARYPSLQPPESYFPWGSSESSSSKDKCRECISQKYNNDYYSKVIVKVGIINVKPQIKY